MKKEIAVIIPPEISVLSSQMAESKQKEVADTLEMLFKKSAQWQRQADTIIVEDHEDVSNIKLANVARLSIKKYRGTLKEKFDIKRSEVQHEMAQYVLEDRLWLKTFQICELKLKHLESELLYKEKTLERYNLQKSQEQLTKRLEECSKYSLHITEDDVETLDEEDYQELLANLKVEHSKEQERLKEIALEEERLVKEKELELEKQKAENERLLVEAEKVKAIQAKKDLRLTEISPLMMFIGDAQAVISLSDKEYALRVKDAQKLLKAAKEEEELKRQVAAKEKAKADEMALELRKIEEAKVLEEARIVGENNQRILEEAKAKELSVEVRLLNWIESFSLPALEVENETKDEIIVTFNKFKKWAVTQIDK